MVHNYFTIITVTQKPNRPHVKTALQVEMRTLFDGTSITQPRGDISGLRVMAVTILMGPRLNYDS